jgi:hypothetical protein
MNAFILKLFDAFHSKRISYCHFKSNNNLRPALAGVDDLDLLVGRTDAIRFVELISAHGFKMATDRNSVPAPFVFHYFGVDPETGLIVHLHVYFKVVTGGSILKNHWIPVESMLLANAQPNGDGGVMIPCAEADLILFTVRKFIEQPSIIEHYLFLKDLRNIRAELDWLIARTDRARLRALVAEWLPEISVSLVDRCIDTLLGKSSVVERVRLGREVRKCFTNTACDEWRASLMRTVMFVGAHLRARVGSRRKDRYVFPGGLLLAFVGSEASGKSTLSKEIASWLSSRFDVCHIHLGKPPKNWRTRPAWWVIATYVKLKAAVKPWHSFRETSVGGDEGALDPSVGNNLPHPLVSWLDSIDRRQWLMLHARKMMEGCIVVTDRYPPPRPGLDGARISASGPLTRWLASRESANYVGLPGPDIVFKTIAPLEVTLQRNALRATPEPESFVRARYALARDVSFPGGTMFEIDTTRTFESTLIEVKQAIWFGASLSAPTPMPAPSRP